MKNHQHTPALALLAAIGAIAVAPGASAQSSTELTAMLPAADGWKLPAKVETFNSENLFDRINGAADIFLACNFVEMTAVDYTKTGADTYVTLQMYRHATPLDAFAIYSAERSPGSTILKIGAEACRETGYLHFLSGRMYVKITTSDESAATAAMMEKVARALAEKIDPNAALPAILKAFPPENKQPASEILVVNSFLGHKFLNNAWRATYASDGKEYQLFIIDGQTREGAEKMLADYYKFNRKTTTPEEGAFTMPDRFLGDIPLLWRGRYIYGVINDSGAAIDAAALLKRLEAAAK